MHSIHTFTFPPRDNLIHLIIDQTSREAAIVDPAWDAAAIADYCREQSLKLRLILLTHSHHDHVNAVHELQRCTPNDLTPTVMLHQAEQPYWSDCPVDAVLLDDGDNISLGASLITVRATPGHTAGSCCYHIGDDLITGDTLFVYGCGRADFNGSDIGALYQSLQKIKQLPPQTRIHPGHDYGAAPSDTLAGQCAGNPFLLCETLDDFVLYRQKIHSAIRSVPYQAVDRDQLTAQLADARAEDASR